jgi:hypothetical protein
MGLVLKFLVLIWQLANLISPSQGKAKKLKTLGISEKNKLLVKDE